MPTNKKLRRPDWMVWRSGKSISRGMSQSNWALYQKFMVSESFTKCSQSGTQNKNKKTHSSTSKHIR
jgi:hypothetical protein